MATRNEITDTILNACKSLIPSVKWDFMLLGAKKSKFIEGTVTCDSVEFEKISKDRRNAKAKYNIVIIELNSNEDIDAYGDLLFKCFDGVNMGGLCYSVDVTRISYGANPNIPTSKAIKLELDVVYPID